MLLRTLQFSSHPSSSRSVCFFFGRPAKVIKHIDRAFADLRPGVEAIAKSGRFRCLVATIVAPKLKVQFCNKAKPHVFTFDPSELKERSDADDGKLKKSDYGRCAKSSQRQIEQSKKALYPFRVLTGMFLCLCHL